MTVEDQIKSLGILVNERKFDLALNLVNKIENIDNPNNKDYWHCNLGLSLSKIALAFSNLELSNRAIYHLTSVKSLPPAFKYEYKSNLARILIHQYHLTPDPDLKLERAKILLASKKLYLELINEHWRISSLNEEQLNTVLCDLIIIVIEFGRWSEAFYYLGVLENLGFKTSYMSYLRARLMNEISDRTCSEDSDYPIFSATILELCDAAIDKVEYSIKTQVTEISEKHRRLFERHKLEIQFVLQKKHKINSGISKYSRYRQFVLLENLGLNEHALFCNCRRSKCDDLKLINRHVTKFHPNAYKIERFELVINKLIREFHIARFHYYQATTKNKVDTYNSEIRVFPCDLIIENRSELLIGGFRQCFGILDKIALVLVKFYKQSPKGDINFENVFTEKKTSLKDHISGEFGGFYLRTIYSIFMDLNRQEYSALAEFKPWRNAIEHGFLFLVEKPSQDLINEYKEAEQIVSYDEFKSKTLLLLHLTQSAIFSLVYLLRKESKRSNLQ